MKENSIGAVPHPRGEKLEPAKEPIQEQPEREEWETKRMRHGITKARLSAD